MAAPLFVALPAIFTALWGGLVACFRWLIAHAHIAKIVGICLLIAGAFKVGRLAYVALCSAVSSYLLRISQSTPSGVSATASFLAKANYCLPISELFALLAVYVSFCGFCLALKFAIASYKAIPFKSA